MAESLVKVATTSRKIKYTLLLPQIEALVAGERNTIARMANICAALKEGMDFFWVGFYLVDGDELVLGPFQGSIACNRIKKGKGVCGAAWVQGKTQVVPNVDLFEGHIACSADTKSEIVVPIFNDNEILAVLDVDSDRPDDFGDVDREWLEKVSSLTFP